MSKKDYYIEDRRRFYPFDYASIFYFLTEQRTIYRKEKRFLSVPSICAKTMINRERFFFNERESPRSLWSLNWKRWLVRPTLHRCYRRTQLACHNFRAVALPIPPDR